MKKCLKCNGSKRLPNETLRLTRFSYRILSWITCYACNGRGSVPAKKGA